MKHWTEEAELSARDVAPFENGRRPGLVTTISIVVHVVFVGLIILAGQTLPKPPVKPPAEEVPLLFEEPQPPRPHREPLRVPIPRVVPPALPAPPPPAAQPQPQPQPQPQMQPQMQPPAAQQPAPQAGGQPAPAKPLLGFNSHGDKKGTPDRPQGPEGKVHGPEAPGEKGKGMKDGGGDDLPKRLPGDEPLSGGSPSPIDEGPNGRLAPPRGTGRQNGPPSFRVPGGIPGRRGPRGSGTDFNVGGGGGFFGDLHFESNDYDWSDYSTKVYFAVYRSWLRELYGRVSRFERDQALRNLQTLDGDVYIRFTLKRDGSVEDLEVLRPSVLPALDDASSAAIRRAVLPALPSDFPRNQERVTYRFRIIGFESARQLQMQLEQSRWAGEF